MLALVVLWLLLPPIVGSIDQQPVWILALVAVLQGDLERARVFTLDCLPVAVQVGYTFVTFFLLEVMATVAVGEGEAALAARFLGAAEVARAKSGEALEPHDHALWQRAVETGCAQLGEAEWERAYQEGRGLPLQEALALAGAVAAEQAHRGEGAVVKRQP